MKQIVLLLVLAIQTVIVLLLPQAIQTVLKLLILLAIQSVLYFSPTNDTNTTTTGKLVPHPPNQEILAIIV